MNLSEQKYDYAVTFKQEILNEFLSCLIADYYKQIKKNNFQDVELLKRKEELENIKEHLFDYHSTNQLTELEKELNTYVDFINIYLDKASLDLL